MASQREPCSRGCAGAGARGLGEGTRPSTRDRCAGARPGGTARRECAGSHRGAAGTARPGPGPQDAAQRRGTRDSAWRRGGSAGGGPRAQPLVTSVWSFSHTGSGGGRGTSRAVTSDPPRRGAAHALAPRANAAESPRGTRPHVL